MPVNFTTFNSLPPCPENTLPPTPEAKSGLIMNFNKAENTLPPTYENKFNQII